MCLFTETNEDDHRAPQCEREPNHHANASAPSLSRRFLPYVRPYKWWILGATLCGLLKFNIPVVFPWVLKDVIDEVLASSDPQAGAIHVRMAFPIALYLLWTAATYFRSYPADHAAQQSCSTSEGDMNDQFVRIFGDNYGIGFGRESADAKARRAADGEST